MEKYAILETGGKQYRVCEGDVIDVELIPGNQGETVTFEEILLVSDKGLVKAGTPAVAGATVVGKVLDHVRGPKVFSYKYKRRKNYRRKVGHRQDYTRVEITGVKNGS